MWKPNVSSIVKVVGETGKTVWDTHGTKILFYGGLACTGLATILAADGAVKATKILEEKQKEKEEPLTFKEQIKYSAKSYAPAFILWTTGAAAQFGGFHTEVTNGASALAAYKMAELAKKELEKSTKNVVGEKKMEKIHKDIAEQHRITRPIVQSKIVITGEGDQLFYEPYSNQYFKSSINTVKDCVHRVNNYIYNSVDDTSTINDFFNYLGIPMNTTWGDDFYFSSGNPLKIDFEYTSDENGVPCAELYYVNEPEYEK